MERREGLIARRKHLDFSQESLAHHLNVSVSTVTSWERGRRLPSPGMRRNLAEALQVSLVDLDRLLGIEPAIELNGHEVPRWLNHYDSLVLAAGRLAQVEKTVIPGLLQTKSYATAVEHASHLGLTDSQVIERVDGRLARQSVLYREPDPLKLVALITEHVLHEKVGDPGVLVEQLDHLAEMGRRANVDIRVLPANGTAICNPTGFELVARPGDAHPFLAVTFIPGGPDYHEGHKMEPFLAMYDHLTGVAMSPADSLNLITKTREDHRR